MLLESSKTRIVLQNVVLTNTKGEPRNRVRAVFERKDESGRWHGSTFVYADTHEKALMELLNKQKTS